MLGAAEAISEYAGSMMRRLHAAGKRLLSPAPAYAGPVGFALALTLLLISARIGLFFEDEGHLWYGAQRVLAGEIPLRDFQGYDPGRYYWTAAVMVLLHSHGWVAMRIAVALFAAVGIWVANTLVCGNRGRAGLWFCLMATFTFMLWMFPPQKLFDIAVSVILVALLAWLIKQPTRYRCFINGVGVGVIAIIGRNHGLYGAIADVGALAFLAWGEKQTEFFPSFICWSAGVALGYAPMLLAIAFVPGFWTWLWASIHVYFEMGATNNNVPVPWPWRVPLTESPASFARDVMVGILLMALPIFGVTVAGYSVWRAVVKKIPVNPMIFAAALLAIPYTHHAYARAGLGHLAQAIYPMLIGIFAWMSSLPRRAAIVLATMVCGLSLFIALPQQPLYDLAIGNDWERLKVGDDNLFVNKSVADRIAVLDGLVEKYAPEGRSFVATPFLPGAYAIFDRRAAVWDPYSFFPADDAVQQAEIARIEAERPGFILIEEATLDNNPAFTYKATNPMVFDFIQKHFVRVDDATVRPWGWDLYIPADAVK